MFPIDLLIAGAGPVGCIIAECAARLKGWRSLVVEKRNHIAGNCHDRFHDSGVLVHSYGPHYFRTNNERLLAYLSRFTDWVPGKYIVRSQFNGKLFPFPINLTTLEMFFGAKLDEDSARDLLASKALSFGTPTNSEQFVLSRVGRELYEAFYLGYTQKQWAMHPRDLAPSVCGRIPVRFNRDDRYVDHGHQLMPANGYTRLFENMLANPLIHVLLQTDFEEVRRHIKPAVATVYCGPIDEYFGRSLGRLGWRSLDFEFLVAQQEFVQPCVQINYPNDHEFTRTVEIKHTTGQIHPHTVISREYPRSSGDPYYPIPAEGQTKLADRYRQLAEQEESSGKLFFAGRLASYRYMNMDESMESAIAVFEKICRKSGTPVDVLAGETPPHVRTIP